MRSREGSVDGSFDVPNEADARVDSGFALFEGKPDAAAFREWAKVHYVPMTEPSPITKYPGGLGLFLFAGLRAKFLAAADQLSDELIIAALVLLATTTVLALRLKFPAHRSF
jgi:hypothetical protein